MNAQQLAKLSRTLAKGATVADLVQATALCRQSVAAALHAMRDEKAAHIMGWQADLFGRRVLAVWKVGAKLDAKRPAAKTQAERQAARRAKIRAAKPRRRTAPTKGQ